MNCIHHWNLDVFPAVCKHGCGETREFPGVRDRSFREMEADLYKARHAIASTKQYLAGE